MEGATEVAHMHDTAIPEVHTFAQVVSRSSELCALNKPRVGLVVSSEIPSLNALAMAREKGLVDATLIGDEKLATEYANSAGIDPGELKFIDINEPDMAVKTAVKMAVAGELDILIKGRVLAVDMIRHMLDRTSGFVRPGSTLSHVAVMKPARYPKLLFLTDAAVNMEPDLKTKLALINNAVRVASTVGVNMPRVALIAAVETVSTQMPVTIDAAIIAKMADRNQVQGAMVDGPLSFDAAVSMFAARAKGLENSPVAGKADILVAPNIETANGVYRAMCLYGNADVAGIVFGGVVPVVLPSRSDSVENRFNSIAMAALAAGPRKVHKDAN